MKHLPKADRHQISCAVLAIVTGFRHLHHEWSRGDDLANLRNDVLCRGYPFGSLDELMPQIEAWLKEPKRFAVVVGAAHLVGPDGLVAQLKARGYRVERVGGEK